MNRKIDYKINENDTGKTVEAFERAWLHTSGACQAEQTDHGY